MITPASVAATVGALLTLLTFWWRLQRERYDVRNRGVNQSPVLTLAYALRYTLYRALVYLVLLYLLLSGYYLVKFRRVCQATPERQAVYDARAFEDRLLEALRWPATYEDGPDCLQ
jgi:hypothetical protein